MVSDGESETPRSPRPAVALAPQMNVRDRWVALLALAVFVALALGSAPYVVGSFPLADLSEPLGNESVGPNLIAAIELYAVLCATALLPAFLWLVWLRRFGGTLAAVGFPGKPRLRAFVEGSLGGCLLILLLGAVLAGSGWYRVRIQGLESTLMLVVIALAFAALYEELLFRGFGFWLLDGAAGPVIAVGASAVLFAVAHSDNSGAHLVGMVNTALAGVLLGLIRWRSGSLWAAWGVHLGWNVALGLLLGAKTSGFSFAGRIMDAEVTATGSRHLVLAGGAYGPEGSLVLTPLLVAWIAWLLRRPKIEAVGEPAGAN